MSEIRKQDNAEQDPSNTRPRKCQCPMKQSQNQNSVTKKAVCDHLNSSSELDVQSSQPVGYCFDVAIGLADILGMKATSTEERTTQARAKLVELALAQSSNKDFRDLLAPEIRHAAALTGEFMNFGIQGSEANILPREMCTEDLQVLVNRFFDAPNDDRVRDAVAACNDALGRAEGARLHLDDLRDLFKHSVNCSTYPSAYKLFRDVWKNVIAPVDIAFAEYCSQESTYKQYLENYYGKGGWFAFQREFSTECSTSMVDVTAKLLDLTVTIYDSKNQIYYRTECYGDNDIAVVYNGVDHFTTFTEPPTPK